MSASGIALPGFTSTWSPATTVSPDAKALRRQDVGLLAVRVLDQRDEGGAVRIVFDPLDGRRHVELAALEIDDAVARLWPPPRQRTVMRPGLLRPPLWFLPSVSALTGLPL